MSTAQKTSSLVRDALLQAEKKKSKAFDVYRRLLTSDSGEPADVKALLESVETLGKQSGEITADRAVIAAAQKLAQDIQAMAGCGTVQDRLEAVVAAHQAFTDSAIQRLREQHRQLIAIQSEAGAAYQREQYLRRELAGYKVEHHELTSLVEMPPAAGESNVPTETIVPDWTRWNREHLELLNVPGWKPPEADQAGGSIEEAGSIDEAGSTGD